MDVTLSSFANIVFLGFLLIFAILFVIAISRNSSLTPSPKERDFEMALADWARQRGFRYTPQQAYVINGVYNNRWFAIRTTKDENALLIRMRLHNPYRTHLQIFGDWLEDNWMVAFVNRFRVYSKPAGFGEMLFDAGTKLREALLKFPVLHARLDLFSDPTDPNHLHYSLLTDLPSAETLEKIMAAMQRFCDAFEQQITQEGITGR